MAVSIVATINYAFGFISKKTYYNLETTLSMAGVTLLYCVTTGIGLIVIFFILPKTEERSPKDIELHFSDDSKKLTDRKIPKTTTIPWKHAISLSTEHSEQIFTVHNAIDKTINDISNQNCESNFNNVQTEITKF